MKTILSLFVALLVTVATTAQNVKTYALTGNVTGTQDNVNIKVYEFDQQTGKWDVTRTYKPAKSYGIELNQNTDYQIWFTDKDGFTKILAVNRETVTDGRTYTLNVDFMENESAQLVRDERGNYGLTLIDTDFVPLRSPFDLYGL